jgi:hypothetical protein
MKRKIFPIFIISLMLMLTIPTNAYSSATDIEQSTGVMSEEEIEKKRALFDSLEQSMGEIESLEHLPQSSIMSTGIQIGTNKTVYPTAGQVYTSDIPARTDAAQGGNWLDCRSEYAPFNSGNGYAWGWIGEYLTVSGSGSRSCDIIINGRYEGVLQAVEIGIIPLIYTSAFGSLYLQVYDVTGGGFTLVKQQKIFERGIEITAMPHDFYGTLGSSQKMTCTLQGGRNYLVRATLRTEAECGTGATGVSVWGLSDFASNPKGANGQGVDISSIRINWN